MAIKRIDDSILQGIAEAIQLKDGGGKMYDTEMRGRIEALPSPTPTQKKVNFYTFRDLAHSYTAEEAAALTEMPEAPVIEGFTFQKWNWTLEKIKTWLQNHDDGELSVGGLYVTSDGHTRIHMTLREAELAHIAMPFCIQQMDGTVVIDWGDGSAPETITEAGIYSHLWQVSEYPANVVIYIEYTPSDSTKLVLGRAEGSTTYGLFNNEIYYAGCVEKVEFGNNVDFLAYSATLKNCTHLREINLPDSITSIGAGAFYNCTSLALIVLPDGITNIDVYAFQYCRSLALIVLSDSITSIGEGAFQNCTNLALTVLPDSITSIDAYAFSGCTNLALTVLPDGVMSIGNSVFQNCTNLALTVLPDSITSIDAYAFSGCTNLALIVLPDSVTSIGDGAFYNCTSLYVIDLTAFTNPQSVPTLVNTYVFQGIPALAEFRFSSQEVLDAFAAATNWSTMAGKFVIKGAV